MRPIKALISNGTVHRRGGEFLGTMEKIVPCSQFGEVVEP
jgi:hypothetical protein